MALAGHSRAARRASSWASPRGAGSRRTTMPSSSRWSKMDAAFSTHWPAPMQRESSMVVCMVFSGSWWVPGQGELVDAVDEHVVAEAQLLERDGQPERREPVEQGLQD